MVRSANHGALCFRVRCSGCFLFMIIARCLCFATMLEINPKSLLMVHPVSTISGCKLFPGWMEFNNLLNKLSSLWLTHACNSTCNNRNSLSAVRTLILGQDTGFEDHVSRVNEWNEFTSCQGKGREQAFSAIRNRSKSNTKRFVVFAAQGCLANRGTWGQVWHEDISKGLTIASDCATGRLYRPGFDGN
jgi:hypothetical protein